MSKLLVILPGGFHPFHAGHMALYNSARQAFPNADLYVAATNSQEERPFPFAVKEKLAKVAGVEPGHFIQVKSPFQAKEITQNYNPEQDVLIFVRSEKDRNESPKPGGTKKDGSPAYFQPYTGKNLQPFGKHAYFAYLPTVKFGPGITSATEIRKAWPTLNDTRKTAMVMSLYPAAQKNQKLAANIVAMLDQVMGGQENVAEGTRMPDANGNYKFHMFAYLRNGDIKEFNIIANGDRNAKILAKKKLIEKGYTNIYSIDIQGMSPVHGPVNYEINRGKRFRLEQQGVAEAEKMKESRVEINQDAPDDLYDIQDKLAMSRWKSSVKNVITSLFAKRYPGVQLFFKNTQDGNLFVTTDKTALASEDTGLYSDTDEFSASIIGPTAEYGVDDILYVGIGFDSIKSGKYKGIVGEMLKTIVPPLAAKFKAKPAIVIVVEDQSDGAWEAMANKLGWAFISGEDDQGMAEGFGLPMPGTYEQEHGTRTPSRKQHITAMTYESKVSKSMDYLDEK